MLDLERFIAGVSETIRRATQPLADRIKALEQREPVPGPRGEPGEKGADGAPGRDGKDADPEAMTAVVREWFERYTKDVLPTLIPEPVKGERGDRGEPGAKGEPGADGKAVTTEDLQPIIEAAIARGLLDLERRAQDVLQRAVDRLPAPKDGKDGKDGRDAFAVEDFDLALSDDERTLSVTLVCGDRRVEKSVRLSHPVYRGVYKAGEKYQKGDVVTFGGSAFVAVRETGAKPETDDSWKLAVKRGRDGRDGEKGATGPKGDRGPAGGVPHKASIL